MSDTLTTELLGLWWQWSAGLIDVYILRLSSHPINMHTNPFTFLLPVLLSFDHGLDTVGERGQYSGCCRFKRDRFSPKVDIVHVYWQCMVLSGAADGCLDVRVIVAVLVGGRDSGGDRFREREWVAPRPSMAPLVMLNGGGGVVGEG